MLTGDAVGSLRDFVAYAQGLDGDEKGEAQVFTADRITFEQAPR